MSDVLPPEQLAYIHAVLAQWHLSPIIAILSVEGQRVFKVTTRDAAFILKHIGDAPDMARLAFTNSVLKHVASTGLRVPVAIRSRSSELVVSVDGQFYQLFDYIAAGNQSHDPAARADLFFGVGQAIARLHQALALYPDPAVSQHTWREDLAVYGNVWSAALVAGLPAPQAALVQRVEEARGAAFADALRGLPEQLIHRDCHPGNIIVDGTRVVGFIDCDHLCIGPRVFDLAYYVVHHLKWITDDSAATRRWLIDLPYLVKGYHAQQPLAPAEVAALPYGMLAYHLLLAYWFMNGSHPESLAVELAALDWIDQHFDAVVAATSD